VKYCITGIFSDFSKEVFEEEENPSLERMLDKMERNGIVDLYSLNLEYKRRFLPKNKLELQAQK
jgi:hypothetical protein